MEAISQEGYWYARKSTKESNQNDTKTQEYYEMRLKECGLTTLETRRLRDQIEVFKILNGYEKYWQKYFFHSQGREKDYRGHGVTLAKKQCRLDTRKFTFSQRTVNEWNRLPADCVGASSFNIFKNKIDIYLRRAGYT